MWTSLTNEFWFVLITMFLWKVCCCMHGGCCCCMHGRWLLLSQDNSMYRMRIEKVMWLRTPLVLIPLCQLCNTFSPSLVWLTLNITLAIHHTVPCNAVYIQPFSRYLIMTNQLIASFVPKTILMQCDVWCCWLTWAAQSWEKRRRLWLLWPSIWLKNSKLWMGLLSPFWTIVLEQRLLIWRDSMMVRWWFVVIGELLMLNLLINLFFFFHLITGWKSRQRG